MSVYARYKKPGGLRQLVELLETTPAEKRQKMIDLGMAEDPEFTRKALACMFEFKDILAMTEVELPEILNRCASGRLIGYAVKSLTKDQQSLFLRCIPTSFLGDAREALELEPSLAEIGGARLKLIQAARSAERAGLLRIKQIPEFSG